MIGSYRIKHVATPFADEVKAYAYALGAPYHVTAGVPVDGIEAGGSGIGKRLLKRDWGIEGRDDLLAQLSSLGFEGHRYHNVRMVRFFSLLWRPSVAARREEYKAAIREGGEAAETAAEELWLLDAVQADLPGLRSAPLLGFDAARAVMLTREGLLLGWLEEGEAWPYLLDLAREVQRSFTSWEDYGADFILSRQVWGGKDSADAFDEIVPLLLSAEDSPWRTVPWNQPTLAMPAPVRPTDGAPLWNLERAATR